MNKKLLTAAIILALVLGIAGAALAASSGGSSSSSDNQWKPPFMNLNLTDDQLSKLRDLRTEFFNKTQDLRSELQKKMFELSNLYLSNNPDQAQIEAKKAEIDKLRSQLKDLSEQSSQEFNKILTQQQKEQLSQMAARRFFGMGMGFGMGGHRGGRGFGCPWGAAQPSGATQ
ncbi:MAG TPA: Spy/CpxP family protein refolding chaperone [Syntrophomonadaceae bacterium]|nr:Spy/CpxP family protein refolding chaperone [Syntrophomonadaceae bacterium]